MPTMLTGLAGAFLVAYSTLAAAQTSPPADPPADQAPPAQTPPAPAQPPADQSQAQPTTQTDPTKPEQQASTQTGDQSQTGAVTAATAADIKAGLSVFDQQGKLVGKVDSVGKTAAIVNTGKVRAEIPFTGFGKSDKGLVVGTTKAELDAAAKDQAAKEEKGEKKDTSPDK